MRRNQPQTTTNHDPIGDSPMTFDQTADIEGTEELFCDGCDELTETVRVADNHLCPDCF